MAMNLPAVVWDFLFYRDLVTDSQTGYVVPPNDYATMADKIVDLLVHPQRALEMGAQGRKVLAERYSWQGLAKQLLAVFG
jgi:glycosyltransferase involved in cell wall biosynthesis